MTFRERLTDVHAFFPVAFVRQQAEPSLGVIAGLLALSAAFWNLHVVFLLLMVVLFGGVDILLGARMVHLREKAGQDVTFSRDRLDDGIAGKAIYLVISFLIGAAIDSALSLTGGMADLGWAGPFKDYTPIASAMLFWRFIREIVSIRRNVELTPGGRDALWPGLGRTIDNMRFARTHPEADGAPARRSSDYEGHGEDGHRRFADLSPEEQLLLVDTLARHRGVALDGSPIEG